MKLFFGKNDEQPKKKMGCIGKTLVGIGVYFLVCGLLGLLMGDMFSTPATVLEDNTVYRIDMKGELVEQGAEENPFESLLPEMYGTAIVSKVGLQDLLSNIALAKNNDKVLGIYLKGGELVTAPASAKTLRDALEDFKQSGKFVLAYAESYSQTNYYIVYTRTNDSDWDNGIRIKTNTYTFRATPGTRYDIRVQAGNDGGVSMPSEVVSAYIAPEEKGRILVLNAFTRVSGPEWFSDSIYAGIRPQSPGVGYGKDISYIGEQFDFDTRHPWITDDECGWGSCYCDQQAALTMGNTFDYPVMHGKALAQLGYSYISANAYAIDTIADVDAVDLIMGKQKTTILGTDTAFKSFTPALQSVITDYLATGGRLLVSGTHIASDMLSADEKAFAKEQLHYTYRCNHASKQGGVVVNTRALEGGQYHFFTTPNPSYIASENPDCIHPADNAVCVARYADTNLSAAIAYDGTDEQKGKTLAWGFMLESTENFDTLYKDCINWIMK